MDPFGGNDSDQGSFGPIGPANQPAPEPVQGIGPQGETGLGGSGQGVTGAAGPQGATGAGIQGATGVQGVQGTTGVGIQGATGAGIQGATGIQGVTGPQGMTGVAGATGVAGLGGGVLYTSTGSSSLGANQTRFIGSGNTAFSSTENQVEIVITRSGTLQNLSVLPISNTRADATTVTVRKNNADTAIKVIIPAGSTAFQQDTVDTVSVVAGDQVSIEISTGGGGGNISLAASVEIA